MFDAGVGFNTDTTEGMDIVGGMGGGISSVLRKVNMFGTLTEHSEERGGNAGGGLGGIN